VTSGFTAGLKIGDAGSEFDQVTFSGPVALAANRSLTVDASGTISLSTSTADLATSGTGVVSLTTARNISLASGSSVTAVDGSITLAAKQQLVATSGNFIGVEVENGLIQSTGTGAVTIMGRGGDDPSGSQIGVKIHANGDVIGGATANVTVAGQGGFSSGTHNYGVGLGNNGSTMTSAGAIVQVTGTGGGDASSIGNFGVMVENAGVITAAGSGTINDAIRIGDGTSISTLDLGGSVTLIGNSLIIDALGTAAANAADKVTCGSRHAFVRQRSGHCH
jgi:hypothetical protein